MRRLSLVAAALILAGCQTRETLAPPSAPATVPGAPAAPARPPVGSAGPLTAATVETYMDAQEGDLRSFLKGQGVLVARRGNDLALTIPSDKLFDGAAVNGWGEAFLESVGQVLAHYDHTLIVVNCYTDSSGGEAQNLAISQKRAKAIASGLVRNGVAGSRVSAYGLGATNLRIADGTDPRNRRIEIKITPNPK